MKMREGSAHSIIRMRTKIRYATPMMKPSLLVVVALALLFPGPATAQSTVEDRVRRVLEQVPLIDGHNDLPGAVRDVITADGDVAVYDLRTPREGDTDLARLRAGGVGGQFWSVYVPSGTVRAARQQLEQIDIALRIIEAYPDHLGLALTPSDVEHVFGSGRIASMLGIEGAHTIENSLGTLRAYFALGVRYATLTHFSNTDWADSATDEVVFGGLSPFGEEVVREMNRLGMLVDLSHVSPGTMSHALNVAEAPVIFSHSGARALTDHARNVPDSILRRLPENGGVVMQVFYPPYVSEAAREHDLRTQEEQARADEIHGAGTDGAVAAMEAWGEANPAPRVPLSAVADHIEHIRDIAGVDHVGLGSDFDGIPTYVEGLEDVSTFPALLMELARRGWTDEELGKVAGENLLRAWRGAEAAARRLQRERPPSTMRFPGDPGS